MIKLINIFKPLALILSLILAVIQSACSEGAYDLREAPRPINLCDVSAFLVPPYLQLGVRPSPATLALLWQATNPSEAWAVDLLQGNTWVALPPPVKTQVAMDGEPRHWVFVATLEPLPAGGSFHYRVRTGDKVRFQHQGTALKTCGKKQRVVLAGDLVSASAASQRACRLIASEIHKSKPDLMVIPGDIVNLDGLARDYRDHFFAAYNAAPASTVQGAPLMRTIPVVACIGNNDMHRAGQDRAILPTPANGMAYFHYFNQPLNGPPLPPLWRSVLLPAPGMANFLAASDKRFTAADGPLMGNFSFDSGDVHWTVLDSNLYVDWADPGMQAWVDQDLAKAADKIWRFVVFHHPCFSLSHWVDAHGIPHYNEGHMRHLWPIFSRRNVDMTFSGHQHSYQRGRPHVFSIPPAGKLQPLGDATMVEDDRFDGVTVTKAQGPIPIVTGAGGARLHILAPAQSTNTHPPPKPYPVQFIPRQHSFTMLDIDGRRLDFRQVDSQGAVLDWFVLTK